MKGKKIVLGITGSIAAYKAAVLTRGLIKKGAEVQVVITPAGKEIRFNGTGKPEGTMSFVVSLQDKTYSRKVIVASQTGRIRLE